METPKLASGDAQINFQHGGFDIHDVWLQEFTLVRTKERNSVQTQLSLAQQHSHC